MTTLRLFVPRSVRCRPVLIAAMVAGSALMTLSCAPSPAAAWGVGRALNPQPLPPGRALNPQPLPPGLYSPYRSGPAGNQMRTPFNLHPSARRVCVAWGRICVKAGQGTKTHPAPCEQWQNVCEKYA
jgi:hypothetical protein